MEDELKALLKQRKELDKRIALLRKSFTACGRAKYELINLPRGSEHTISILRDTDEPLRNRYYSLIQHRAKEKMLESLEQMIADLSDLKNELKGVEE